MANFTLGLDLGQAQDYSAAVLVERVQAFAPGGTLFEHDRPWTPGSYRYDGRIVCDTYAVRHIRRWPLGTAYPAVVEDVSAMMQDPELRHECVLALDYGGVGRAVEDMFVDAYRNGRLGDRWPKRVTLTGGFAQAHSQGTSAHKGDVIAKLLTAAQRGRVTIAPELPLAKALEYELRSFTLKQSRSGGVRFEAARQSDHDDILLALALAVWHRHWVGEPRYTDETGLLREKPPRERSLA